MGKSSPTVSARPSVFQSLTIAFSLLLNVFLAVYLLKGKSTSPGKTKPLSVPIGDSIGAKDSPKSSSAEVSSVTEATNEIPPLQWSAIESTDLKQYIANLRAAGCPEQIIRDIIVSNVNQDYLKRAREIWPLRATEYWQKNQQSNPGPKQMDQLIALDKEHQELFKELLGTRISRQELIDTLYLQVHGDEQQLLFLPEERREAALKALADTDLESEEAKLRSNGNFYGGREEQKLFNERLKTLADVLTPEELEEFHLRNSPTASILKSETRYLNLTPEEYKQLLLARESGSEREQTKETVRKLFGEERAKEFEQVSSAFYINARTGAEAEESLWIASHRPPNSPTILSPRDLLPSMTALYQPKNARPGPARFRHKQKLRLRICWVTRRHRRCCGIFATSFVRASIPSDDEAFAHFQSRLERDFAHAGCVSSDEWSRCIRTGNPRW
jgi:hypothetical protein